MRNKLRLDLDLVLPEAADAADACVRRLQALLTREPGISGVHVTWAPNNQAPMLCLHYDPGVLSTARVRNRAAAAGARITERYGHVTMPLRLVGAEDIAGRVEGSLRTARGVLDVSVNLAAQQIRVEFDREATTQVAIASAINRIGLGEVRPAANAAAEAASASVSWYSRNKELVWSLAAGLLLSAGFAGERWLGVPRVVAIALYAGAYVFGGFDLVKHAVVSTRKSGFQFDIELLMIVAAAGAAALGEWAEGAFLLFLFAIAHAMEHYALDRARGAIRALGELAPRRARVKRDGGEEEVPVEQVVPGAVVIVRPAERIPVDGTVSAGSSAVNQAPITGESVPVEKTVGAEVFAVPSTATERWRSRPRRPLAIARSIASSHSSLKHKRRRHRRSSLRSGSSGSLFRLCWWPMYC